MTQQRIKTQRAANAARFSGAEGDIGTDLVKLLKMGRCEEK
jgi:hypothetical protein